MDERMKYPEAQSEKAALAQVPSPKSGRPQGELSGLPRLGSVIAAEHCLFSWVMPWRFWSRAASIQSQVVPPVSRETLGRFLYLSASVASSVN